jgi:hypothetical protein
MVANLSLPNLRKFDTVTITSPPHITFINMAVILLFISPQRLTSIEEYVK